MTAAERLLPADAGSELADCRGMFGVIVLPAGLTASLAGVFAGREALHTSVAFCCRLHIPLFFRHLSRNSQKNRFIFSFLHITCIEHRGDMRASGPPEIERNA